MAKTLHIFDSADANIVKEANARRDAGRVLVPVSAEHATNLERVLDVLLNTGETADQIFFDTHGAPGKLIFKTTPYDKGWFLASKGKGWERLISASSYPRVYFRGCHIAQGDAGRAFMEAIGAAFLPHGYGSVTAHIGLGYFYIPNVYTGSPYDGDVTTLFFRDGKPIDQLKTPAHNYDPELF